MLYTYYGKDIDTARAKVQATVAKMLAKSPEALYFRITSDNLSEYDFDELTGSQSLFKSEYIVVLDTLFETKEGEVILLENLKKIQEAPHPFFLLENTLRSVTKKKIEKASDKMQEFEGNKEINNTFNTFSLTDALGVRDVQKLWTLFREAKQNKISDEEIHGILFWALKSILFAIETKSADEAGMKPYPYKKAKQFATHFSSTEKLKKQIAKFVLLPQEAHHANISLDIFLERFILSL